MQTKQDIENVFARLGIQQSTGFSGLGSGFSKFGGFNNQPPVELAGPPVTTAFQQFTYGLTSPFRIGAEKLGVMEKAPAPTNVGGKIGNVVGNLVGWGAVFSLIAATFGTGAVALTGATAGTVAAKAVSSAAAAAVTGGYRAWASKEDSTVDDVVQGAAKGAALDLAFLGAGQVLKSAKQAVDTSMASTAFEKAGFDSASLIAQKNPQQIREALETIQPKALNELYSKTLRIAKQYGLKPIDPQNMTSKDKIKFLQDLVNNVDTYSTAIYQPMYKYANDLLLKGTYSSGLKQGVSSSMKWADPSSFQILGQASAGKVSGDFKTPESRAMKELTKLAVKTKALGGNLFRRTTDSEEINEHLKRAAKDPTIPADIAYLNREIFESYTSSFTEIPSPAAAPPTIRISKSNLLRAVSDTLGGRSFDEATKDIKNMGLEHVVTPDILNQALYVTPTTARRLAKLPDGPIKKLWEAIQASRSMLGVKPGELTKDGFKIPNTTDIVTPNAADFLGLSAAYQDYINVSTTHGLNSVHIKDFNGLIKAMVGEQTGKVIQKAASVSLYDIEDKISALAKSATSKKMSMPYINFSDGTYSGLDQFVTAEKAGVQGVPVAFFAPDPDTTDIYKYTYILKDSSHLATLLADVGVEEGDIHSALYKAKPLAEKDTVWMQITDVEKELRNCNRGIKGIYKRHQVANFEGLNTKLQDLYEQLNNSPGDKTILKSIKQVEKAIKSWKYYVDQADQADKYRQELVPYVENLLDIHKRKLMESPLNQFFRSDPNITQVSKKFYSEPVRDMMDKYKVTNLKDLDWKNAKVVADWRQIMTEAKRTGAKPVQILQIDAATPTQYDVAKGTLQKLVPLAPNKPLTEKDVAKLGEPNNPFSVLNWLPRNRFTEPLFRMVRNSDIQKKEFTTRYKNILTDIIGKENMKVFSKTAKQYRHNLAVYLENPAQMDADNVSDVIRNKVDELRELFNILGKEEFNLGEQWQENYIPHIVKAYRKGDTLGITPKNIRAKFKLERTGDMPEELREMDVWKLFNYYIESGAKEKFYEPVFDNLDPLFGVRLRAGAKVPKELERIASESNKLFYERFKRRTLGIPGEGEEALDNFIGKLIPQFAKDLLGIEGSQRYSTQISAFMSELAYSGTLGYNPFSAIKNLTQQISAVAHLDQNPLVGLDYWWKARKFMSTDMGQDILENFNVIRSGRNPQEALDLQMLTMANVPLLGPVQKNAFKMFQWADSQNIDTSWMMRFLYDQDQGFSIKEAAESAYSFTMATQYMYGIDSPLMFKGPFGRQLGMLMSWPINYAAEMQQLGDNHEWLKAVNMVAAYAFGAEALSLTGLSFRSIHPTEVAKGFLPIAMMEGEQSLPLSVRFGLSSYQQLKALASGDETAQAQAWDNFKKAARAYVPFSTQGTRILEVIEAVRNDFQIHERTLWSQITNSEEGKGRLRYEKTKAETFLTLLGPTTNANNRWQALDRIAQTEAAYRRLRTQAVEAFLNGDYETFTRRMEDLRSRFGGKVNIQDIQQEIELRSMPAIQRRATSLPEGSRLHF